MNATKTDHRSLPRQKRAPSERDQAIYAARHSLGWTQARLAKKYHVSQRRISTILKRVEQWLGNARPLEQGELDAGARLRLERRLEHERARAVYDKAMRAFDTGPKELKTTKKGKRGDVEYHEEVTREQPVNVQLLRTALLANADLRKVADKPAPPKQPTPEQEEERRRRDALNWLYEQRFKAESDCRVPKSNDGSGAGFGSMDTVELWLDALLGTQESVYFHEANEFPREQFEPGRALSHLANYLPRALEEQSVFSRDPTWSRSDGNNAISNSAVGNALRGVPALRGAADSADGTPTGGTPGAGLLPAKSKKRPWQEELTREAVAAEFALVEMEPQEKDRFVRKILTERKVAKFKELRRRGLPFMMEFDPEDGPVPPTYYQLDGYEPKWNE